MKILFLSDDFPPQSYGGAGIVAFKLSQGMLREGHQVAVVTTVQDKQGAGRLEYEGLMVYKLYSNYLERWQAYLSLYHPSITKQVKKIIKEWQPDVVHAHNIHYHLSYHSLKLAKESGAKVFLTAHDVMLFHYGKLGNTNDRVSPRQQLKKFKKRYNPFRNVAIRHYLKYVDKILAVSYALKDALNQNGILNVEVVHNGIDADSWQVDPATIDKFKEKYNLHGKKVVFFGGRLGVAKGGNQAVLLIAEVTKKIPEAVLLVMGPQNVFADEMVKYAKTLNIEKHLVFTGWISGTVLKAAYGASDLVCVLSIYMDPFPTVVLEAMACSRPVIGTCFGGTKEMVDDKITGFLINPLDVGEARTRTVELLNDPLKAQGFGKAGFNKVLSHFTLAEQVRKVLQYYQEEI